LESEIAQPTVVNSPDQSSREVCSESLPPNVGAQPCPLSLGNDEIIEDIPNESDQMAIEECPDEEFLEFPVVACEELVDPLVSSSDVEASNPVS
jgi:hypothetical protein